MAQVNTVLGPIHPDQLGTTSMHEHVLWNTPGWEYSPEANQHFDAPKIFEKVYNDFIDYKAAGGQTVVDCSGIGIGRDPELYALFSRRAKVNIVACTGFWAQEKILPYFAERDIDYNTELFVRELTQGMGTTNIKAGVIKVGNGRTGVSPLEKRMYQAAARAAKKTGCAVITHGINAAREHFDILLKEGLDAGRIVISHCDALYNLDFERDKEIAQKGGYVAYDHIGIEKPWSPMDYAMPDAKRVELVKAFIEAGYLKQLVISCDTNMYAYALVHRGTPLCTIDHLLKRFVPLLREGGVTEEMIHTMLVETPKRILPF